MTIYPRNSNDYWHDKERCDRAWAHQILDQYKAGETLRPEVVDKALRLTGDLLGYSPRRWRAPVRVAQ